MQHPLGNTQVEASICKRIIIYCSKFYDMRLILTVLNKKLCTASSIFDFQVLCTLSQSYKN